MMEIWQRERIKRKLPDLIKATDCNEVLLTTLQSKNILSDEDVQNIQCKETKLKKSSCLFEILQNREESYDALISALRNTCQSGAVKLLVETIRFQGKDYLFCELLPNPDENFKEDLTNLQKQESCVEDVVVKNTLPCKLDYYISRTILSRRKLDKSLFQERCSDIFLFQGLQWHELARLADKLPTDNSSDILNSSEKVQARYVLLKSIDHFDSIADKTNDPVHLIKHINGTFHWIKSRGPVETIQKFVDTTPNSMSEVSFIQEILKQPISICLTDSPGMGKTVLLANLLRAIVANHPMHVAIFIYLREFIPVLQAKLIDGTKLNDELIQNVLSEHVSDHPIGRRIVSHKLVNEPCYLCFDGYDEVLPEQREVAKAMLRLIKNSFRNCQMFVTARLHMRVELEQAIGTLGYHISPFNMENRIDFLTMFWKHRKAENENLEEYAKLCLTTLADQMSEDGQEIAGIPLQCFMIGEVFLKTAKSYIPDSDLGAEVPIKSMAELYEKLIYTKLDVVKVGFRTELVIEAHIHSALVLLFPEDVVNLVKYPKGISEEQLCRVGIMERSADTGVDGGLRFVHRTFAEFFVALFTARILQDLGSKSKKFTFQNKKAVVPNLAKIFVRCFPKKPILSVDENSLTTFILKKVLATYGSRIFLIDNPLGREYATTDLTSTYQHPVIAYFLNFQLQNLKQEIALKLHIEFGREELYNYFLAAVSQNCYKLLNLYVSMTFSFGEYDWYELQCAAITNSDLNMLKNIIDMFQRHGVGERLLERLTKSEKIFQISFLLYLASFVGNIKIVEYLLKSMFVNLDDTPFVFHFCMWYSSIQPESVIQRKVQIMKYLVDCASSVLRGKYKGLTPIVGKYIHFDLLKCALESGANIYDQNKDLKSILHITPEYLTPEEYHELSLLVVNQCDNDNKILTERDVFECTPLHYAVQYLPILPDTLIFFLNQGADINAKDKKGNSVLFYALENQSETTLKLLVRSGANLNARNLDNETVLHIAYKYDNTSAVKWLVELGADEKAQNTQGLIPSKAHVLYVGRQDMPPPKNMFVSNDGKNKDLYNKKMLGFPDTFDIKGVDEMMELNANKYQKRNTQLHFEFCKMNIDIEKIKFQFISLNADFNARNADGDTPLHLGVMNTILSKEVLDYAVNIGGANLNLVNNCELSVLAQAIQANKNVSFLKLLVEYGAEVCKLCNLEAAIVWYNLENVKFLIEHGIDVIKVSRESRTGKNPISYALKLGTEPHFDIAKYLIASTPQLSFDKSDSILEIIEWAIVSYNECERFKTAELFNLMASHGLNFGCLDTCNKPVFFSVIQNLEISHVETFLKHMMRMGNTNLGELKDCKSQNVVQTFIENKETDFPVQLLPLLGDTKKILNSSDFRGHSVLAYAIRCSKSVEYMEKLIENGADVNHLDKDGGSLLHYAAQNGDLKSVDFFMNQLNDKNLVDNDGKSALHWALQKETQNYDIVKLLVSKGVSVNLESSLRIKTIDVALRAYKRWINFESAEIFTLMIAHGLDIESKGFSGSPILFEIINTLSQVHCEEVLTYLYQNNKIKCFNLRGNGGDTLLHRCVNNFDPSGKLFNIFKMVNSDFDAKDMVGNTVLAYAVLANRTQSTILALRHNKYKWRQHIKYRI